MVKKQIKAKPSMKAKAIKTLKAAGTVIVAVGLIAGTIGYFVQKSKASDLTGQLADVQTALKTSQANATSLDNQTKILSEELNKVGLELVNISATSELKDSEISELKALVADMKADAENVAAANEELVFVGYDEDFGLGDSISLDLNDNQLEKLADYDVQVDDEDVSVQEYLKLNGEFNHEDTLNMDFNEESINYIIEYDNETGAVISEDNSLDIQLLGKDVQIIGVEDGKLTIKTMSDSFVKEGAELNGVEVLRIGESSVLLKVGDETEAVSENSNTEINGIKVEVGTIFYVEGTDDNLVSLKAGEELEKVYKLSGDDKYYDADKMWKFSTIEPGKIVLTNVDEFKEVESVSLPNDFAKISYDLNDVDYQNIKVEKEDGAINKVHFELENYDSTYAEYKNGTWVAEEDDETIDFAAGVELKDSDFDLVLGNAGNVTVVNADGTKLVVVKSDEVKIDGSTDFDNDLDFISNDGLVVKPTEDFVSDDDETLVIAVPEETVEATILVE